MCEILGANLKREHCLNDYLKIFYSHSTNHPHGWGLAYEVGKNILIEKEPLQASKSEYLNCRLSQPIISKNILAHIRYATIGNIEPQNCHPYSKKDNFGRQWTLIHNGTIFDYSPLNKFIKIQEGQTDSERILLYIIEQINIAQNSHYKLLKPEERFKIINDIVSDMSKGNKLNLLIFDGEYLYVHTNYAKSLHYLETENGIIFSTLPLTDENWQAVPFTTLLAYKDGELKFTGTKHGNEYEDNEETMRFLYQIFSDL